MVFPTPDVNEEEIVRYLVDNCGVKPEYLSASWHIMLVINLLGMTTREEVLQNITERYNVRDFNLAKKATREEVLEEFFTKHYNEALKPKDWVPR